MSLQATAARGFGFLVLASCTYVGVAGAIRARLRSVEDARPGYAFADTDSSLQTFGSGTSVDRANKSRTTLVMYFIGAKDCGFSQPDAIGRELELAITSVAAEARRRHITLALVGIAVDARAEDGIPYLKQFPRFTELVAGNGWDNALLATTITDPFGERAITPQIVVVERVRTSGAEPDRTTLRLRLSGATAIKRWVALEGWIPPPRWPRSEPQVGSIINGSSSGPEKPDVQSHSER